MALILADSVRSPTISLLGAKKIADIMSESTIRRCYKCSATFHKGSGCNKIDCLCGAKMCYICRQPVEGYAHFYNIGLAPTGTRTCPIWSSDKEVEQLDLALAAQKLNLIPDPVAGPAGGEPAFPPDVAPGLPREELVIEDQQGVPPSVPHHLAKVVDIQLMELHQCEEYIQQQQQQFN